MVPAFIFFLTCLPSLAVGNSDSTDGKVDLQYNSESRREALQAMTKIALIKKALSVGVDEVALEAANEGAKDGIVDLILKQATSKTISTDTSIEELQEELKLEINRRKKEEQRSTELADEVADLKKRLEQAGQPDAGSCKVCAKCDDGYSIDGAFCKANVCTCKGGIAVDPADSKCTSAGKEVCKTCNEGYTLEGVTCKANVCTCKGGTAVDPSDSRCTSDGEEVCKTCNEGYTLDGVTCKANVCTCKGGPALSPGDPRCSTNGAELCYKCDDGYTLDGVTCKANVCTCEGGPALNPGDPKCTTDGTKVCATCNAGYTLDGVTCKANVCTCNEGIAVEPGDSKCTRAGTEVCKTCNPGYTHLDDYSCKETCANYSCPTAWSTRKGKEKSTTLSKSNCCEANVCTCKGGTAVEPGDSKCTVAGTEICKSCNVGHTLDGDICKANVCPCKGGPGLTPGDPKCDIAGTEFCDKCYDGYTLHQHKRHDMNYCKANVCFCKGGTAVHPGDSKCKVNGTEVCKTCNPGYTMLDDQTCSACNRDTGGTCTFFGCNGDRGPTVCEGDLLGGKKCLCASGHCAYNGKCVKPASCQTWTPGTCKHFGCSSKRGAVECKDGECVCKPGACAVDGVCVESCEKDTGDTCQSSGCKSSLNAECKSGKCMCGHNDCAYQGSCENGRVVEELFALAMNGTAMISRAQKRRSPDFNSFSAVLATYVDNLPDANDPAFLNIMLSFAMASALIGSMYMVVAARRRSSTAISRPLLDEAA